MNMKIEINKNRVRGRKKGVVRLGEQQEMPAAF